MSQESAPKTGENKRMLGEKTKAGLVGVGVATLVAGTTVGVGLANNKANSAESAETSKNTSPVATETIQVEVVDPLDAMLENVQAGKSALTKSSVEQSLNVEVDMFADYAKTLTDVESSVGGRVGEMQEASGAGVGMFEGTTVNVMSYSDSSVNYDVTLTSPEGEMYFGLGDGKVYGTDMNSGYPACYDGCAITKPDVVTKVQNDLNRYLKDSKEGGSENATDVESLTSDSTLGYGELDLVNNEVGVMKAVEAGTGGEKGKYVLENFMGTGGVAHVEVSRISPAGVKNGSTLLYEGVVIFDDSGDFGHSELPFWYYKDGAKYGEEGINQGLH